MSTKPPKPPNSVPEEDLNLHEDFSPIIAENGLIRQPKAPEVNEESLPAFLTRLDTLQDLVQLRHAEQEAKKAQEEELQTDRAIEHTITGKPVLNLEPAPEPDTPTQTRELALTSTHLPTVRQAQTTALMPVSKLTLTRRITLLRRKRQHKRRLALRAKKRAAQAAAVPPKTPPPQPTASPKRPSRWGWVLAVLLFLFLGGIGGLVPVEKIPLLRELAYAMGFDKNDTSRMSFLRALLTWTDKTVGLPGNWSDEKGGTSLFARRGNKAGAEGETSQEESDLAGLEARLSRLGGQTSLIDMQALNALQRKKGYALDGVRGAVALNPGQEEADLGPAVLRDDAVNVRTEANRDKGEVFFGSDNSAINRNFKDGYDSSKTLASVKNPHIANGVPIDWLTNMTKRTLKTDTALNGINKELNSTQVAWGGGMSDMGEKKEHRDLYHAWITSRMSKYTPNIMLKKGLADSSFLGADIPTMASNVLSFSGIQVDIEAMSEDESAWKEYLEFEKNCREELMTGGGSLVTKAVENVNRLFPSMDHVTGTTAPANVNFPQNCNEALKTSYEDSDFRKKTVKTFIDSCAQMQEGYKQLQISCLMQVEIKENRCEKNDVVSDEGGTIGHYRKLYTDFQNTCKTKYCEAEVAAHQNDDPPLTMEECLGNASKITKWDEAWPQGKAEQSEDMDARLRSEIGGTKNYFPQIIKDEQDQPGKENVTETINRDLGESQIFFQK